MKDNYCTVNKGRYHQIEYMNVEGHKFCFFSNDFNLETIHAAPLTYPILLIFANLRLTRLHIFVPWHCHEIKDYLILQNHGGLSVISGASRQMSSCYQKNKQLYNVRDVKLWLFGYLHMTAPDAKRDTWSGGLVGLIDDPVSCCVLLYAVYVPMCVPPARGDRLCISFALCRPSIVGWYITFTLSL